MDAKTIVAGVLMDANTSISYVEICQKCNISEDVLYELLEHGLVNTLTITKKKHLDAANLARIKTASRLHHDLNVNIPGVVLVLELLDELNLVRNELTILQHHVNKDD